MGKIWCWSKIQNGEGTTIRHKYYHKDAEKTVIELDIGSPLWRTYSSKRILPSWTGQWRVEIIDAENNVLRTLSFTIGETPKEGIESEDLSAAEEGDDS